MGGGSLVRGRGDARRGERRARAWGRARGERRRSSARGGGAPRAGGAAAPRAGGMAAQMHCCDPPKPRAGEPRPPQQLQSHWCAPCSWAGCTARWAWRTAWRCRNDCAACRSRKRRHYWYTGIPGARRGAAARGGTTLHIYNKTVGDLCYNRGAKSADRSGRGVGAGLGAA